MGVGLALLFAATLAVAVLSADDRSSDPVARDDLTLEAGSELDELYAPERLADVTAVAPALPEATLTVHDDGCGVAGRRPWRRGRPGGIAGAELGLRGAHQFVYAVVLPLSGPR